MKAAISPKDVFADFILEVSGGSPSPADPKKRRYAISSVSSAGGKATLDLDLDPTAEPLATQLVQVAGSDSDLSIRETVGQTLFNMLFGGTVRDLWTTAKTRAEAEGVGLRLRLSIDSPELSVLPWELLRDGSDFLATRADTPLSRFLPVAPAAYLPPQDVLRVLVVVQDPGGQFAITPAEIDALETALTALKPSVDFKTLRNAPIAEIQAQLQAGYHVLHYLGHGAAGRLFLAGEQRLVSIDDGAFAQLFSGRRSLRLVVLNACSSAQANEQGLFSGVGPALVAKRIPAVVSMQYQFVQLTTASRFSQALYRGVVSGMAVDSAVNEARQLLSAGTLLATRDWSTPVLYMSTSVGRIIDIGNKRDTVTSAWKEVKEEAGKSTRSAAAAAEVVQKIEEFATLQRDLLGELKTSAKLLLHIRDVASGFDPIASVIASAAAANNPLALLPAMPSIQSTWGVLNARALAELTTFLDQTRPVDNLSSLSATAAAFKQALDDLSLKELLNRGKELTSLLNQAEIRLEQELDTRLDAAIQQLTTAAELTIGRLSGSIV
jgi:hypothetical protein